MKVLPFAVAAAAVLLSACASTSNPADGATTANAAVVSGNGASTAASAGSSLNPAQTLPQVDAVGAEAAAYAGVNGKSVFFDFDQCTW